MIKKQVNLEKVIDNLGENIFPQIEYFIDGVATHSDGNVDGSCEGLYEGLIDGVHLDEFDIDESILKSDDAVLKLCE